MARSLVFVLVLATLPAMAATVNSPACNRDLMRADQLIRGVAARENSVRKGDIAGLCRLLRLNQTEMTQARDLMNPCMTGRDQSENVGQLDASLADIKYAIGKQCR
jgi:hypothetical protein